MKRIGVLAVLVMIGCEPRAEGAPVAGGGTEGDWDWAGSSWGSSGWFEERQADIRWSTEFGGVPTDLLRGASEHLVAGHVDGVATVWRVSGRQGATQIWSSEDLGRDAKLVRTADGSVLVVALAPGGVAFAPLDESAASTFVPIPHDRSGLVGAVAGTSGELWVALGGTSAQDGHVVRIGSDGTARDVHRLRDGGQVVGILRDPQRRRTVAFGNTSSGDGWERCIPDDGNPASGVTPGWRVAGAWIDGSRAMAGFDAGGAGCAMEIDCDDGEGDVDELVMPMPTQAAGRWSYGHDSSRVILARDWTVHAHDIAGELVRVDGDEHGVAIALTHEAGRARVVKLAAP